MSSFDLSNSILDTVKKLLNVDLSDASFDQDLIIFSNTTFAILNQLGVGPTATFSILDNTAKWSDFTNNPEYLALIVSYVASKTRVMFDPPTSATHLGAINASITELEHRLLMTHDTYVADPVESEDP